MLSPSKAEIVMHTLHATYIYPSFTTIYAYDNNTIVSAHGWARAVPLSRALTVGKGVLVGIIDGAPPIPAANFQAAEVFSATNILNFDYGVTTVNTDSWENNFSLAFGTTFDKRGSKVGGVDVSVSFFAGYTRGVLNTKTETRTKQYKVIGSTTGAGGIATANNTGTAVVYQPAVCGYEFTLTDTNGVPIPNTNVFYGYQVFPQSQVTGDEPYSYKSFTMDPTAEDHIRPGDLTSYLVSPEQFAALQLATTRDIFNRPIQVNAAMAGALVGDTRLLTLDSHQVANGAQVDLTALVGYGAETDAIKIHWMGGIKASYTHKTTALDSTATTFGVTWTGVIPNGVFEGGSGGQLRRYVPGMVSDYKFHVFHLRPNAAYAQELFTYLENYREKLARRGITPDPGTRYLLESVSRDAAPWKITYAIRNVSTDINFYDPSNFGSGGGFNAARGLAVHGNGLPSGRPAVPRLTRGQQEQANQMAICEWQKANPNWQGRLVLPVEKTDPLYEQIAQQQRQVNVRFYGLETVAENLERQKADALRAASEATR